MAPVKTLDIGEPIKKEEEEEYLISGDPSKYVTLPIQHDKIWRKYQTTLDRFWTVHDVYLANDKADMLALLTQEERNHLIQLLTFMFTTHYTTITKELFMDFMSQVDIKEASYYFGSQADAKKTHTLMYSFLIDELTSGDAKSKHDHITEVLKEQNVKDLLSWAILNTSTNSYSFSHRLLTFATMQGIIFTVPFLVFEWIINKDRAKLGGLSSSNELIWKDEKLNLAFSCSLFDYLEDDSFTELDAQRIIKEAVGHAKRIFTQTFPVNTVGIDCRLIEEFIEYSANQILIDIGLTRLYKIEKSPFDWVKQPKVETYHNKSINSYTDLSSQFGEAKFDTAVEF